MNQPNESELQLKAFLEHTKSVYTTMMLSPQGDNTIIERLPHINLCTVSNKGKDYLFGGISESFYDIMVEIYDWREKEINK